MKNTTIKTNLFRVRYKRNDGKKQLKVLAKVGYLASDKFNEVKRFEVTIRDKFNNVYLVNDQQYERLRALPPTEERLQLFHIETKIKKILFDFIEEGRMFSVKDINNKLYALQSEEAVDTKVKSWNDFLNKIGSDKEELTYQREEIERIEKEIETAIDEQTVITDEEIDNIKDSVGLQIQIEKERDYVKTLSQNERYSKGEYNRNSIIEVFGFCWSINPKNGDSYIANSYKSLIFHLVDYILNGNSVSNSIKDFNLKWVEDFLTFKVNHGYPKIQIRDYTPFDILQHKDAIIKANRESFKASSFQKIVKYLKQYINILQKQRILSINAINTNHFEASEFISRSTNTDNYTRIEYTLEYEEIEELLNASFEDKKMQLATDMYIIQMFAGGLRPVEMYKGNLRFIENHVSFYRSKNKKISKNPILPEVKEVLEKYPDGLPVFLNISTYREQLKKVARHFNWNRIISEPDTRLKSEKNVIEYKLQEIFSPLTARKTFINYLANLGLPDELIIQFTDHTDVKILKHYKRKLNLEQKRRIIQKFLENFYK